MEQGNCHDAMWIISFKKDSLWIKICILLLHKAQEPAKYEPTRECNLGSQENYGVQGYFDENELTSRLFYS